MKKIYKQWTVKSFDLEKFDDEINSNIEIGWEIVEGSYLISDVDGKKVFSQVLVWKDDDENLELDFFYSDDNNTMTVIRNHNHNDEKGTSTKIIWEKDKFGQRYSKIEEVKFLYKRDEQSDPYYTRKFYRVTNKYGKISELIEYNEDGIRDGEYIYHNIEGSFKDGKPYGTWSVSVNPWGVLIGEYWDEHYGEIEVKNHCISFYGDFKQKLYEELNKNTNKEERVVQKQWSDGSPYKWKQEDFQEIKKSYIVFKSTYDYENFKPLVFFGGSIQLRTQKWDNSDKKNLEIQVIDGKMRQQIEGFGDLNEKKEFKIEKYHNPKDEFKQDQVITRETTYCLKNNSVYQDYIVKEFNPKTKSLLKKLIYFPKTFGQGQYLDSSERICVEQYYSGEIDNDPKGTWKRYFPDGQLNLIVEFLPYTGDETLNSKKYTKTDRLFEKVLKYFDSNGVLRYESSSIIVVTTTGYGLYGHPPQQSVIKLLDERYYGEISKDYDILFGLDWKLDNLKNCLDTFDKIYIRYGQTRYVDSRTHDIKDIFSGQWFNHSYDQSSHQEFLMDKYYKWDKNGILSK